MIAAGKLPAVAKLTRKQRRALDAAGFNLRKTKFDTTADLMAGVDNMADWVLDTIYPGFDFDDLDDDICRVFALYTYQNTYDDDLAAKNS
jgi:hypothetical protein